MQQTAYKISEIQPIAHAEPAALAEASVAIVRDIAGWDALEGEWKALFDASPTASPALRWEWQRDWWALYGPVCADARPGDESLRIAAVRRDGRLIGLLPLYVNRGGTAPFHVRRLMFLSTGEAEEEELCAEYPDLLHLPGEAETCTALLRAAILQDPAADWDRLELENLSARSPLLEWSADRSPVSVEARELGPGYTADLSRGFEGYLESLSPNSRAQARKHLRKAEQAGAAVEFARDPESAAPIFAELCRLHQSRWQTAGKPGCFGAARFEEFHFRQAMRGVASGEALLARLRWNDETLAVVCAYTAAAKCDFYVSGAKLQEVEGIKSPGILLHLLITKELCARGVEVYDYLAGDSRYKQQLTTGVEPRFALHMERPTLRGAVGRTATLAGRILRRGQRILAGPSTARPSLPSAKAERNDG